MIAIALATNTAEEVGAMTKGTLRKPKQVQDFITKLCLMKAEAGKLGLFRTMHDLEKPQQTVGWEVADIMAGKQTQIVARKGRRGILKSR